MTPSLLILTGASGSGKTSLAEWINGRFSSVCEVLSFDSVGVPSPEAMETDYGSGELWQRAMTRQWMERILPLLSSRAVLFE